MKKKKELCVKLVIYEYKESTHVYYINPFFK